MVIWYHFENSGGVMKKILSAYTTLPNTKETDQMPQVLHDVSIQINGVNFLIEIMAQDPMDAIDKAYAMSEDECLEFKKQT